MSSLRENREELKNVLRLAFFFLAISFRDSLDYENFFSYESEKFPLTSEIYYIAHRWQPSEGRKKRASYT